MNDEELRTADFNRITDRYLREGVMTAEDYESLTPLQKTCVQWVKRAYARLNKNERVDL